MFVSKISAGIINYPPQGIEEALTVSLEQESGVISQLLEGQSIPLGSQSALDAHRLGTLILNDIVLLNAAAGIVHDNYTVFDAILMHVNMNVPLAQKIFNLFNQLIFAPLNEAVQFHPTVKGLASVSGTEQATYIKIEKNIVKIVREVLFAIRPFDDVENPEKFRYVKAKVTISGDGDDFVLANVEKLKIAAIHTSEKLGLIKGRSLGYTSSFDNWWKRKSSKEDAESFLK